MKTDAINDVIKESHRHSAARNRVKQGILLLFNGVMWPRKMRHQPSRHQERPRDMMTMQENPEMRRIGPFTRYRPPACMLRPEHFPSRECGDDAIHARLRKSIEKRQKSYLWTPADAIVFKPYVCPTIYGDGRALFKISTIYQRPAYWVIRACSTWACYFDREDTDGPEFAEMTEVILTDLENAFGRGRCGYSGSSLFEKRKYRMQFCQCAECSDTIIERWPAVDGGGCSWSRLDWPREFQTTPNPLSSHGNLLDCGTDVALPPKVERGQANLSGRR